MTVYLCVQVRQPGGLGEALGLLGTSLSSSLCPGEDARKHPVRGWRPVSLSALSSVSFLKGRTSHLESTHLSHSQKARYSWQSKGSDKSCSQGTPVNI